MQPNLPTDHLEDGLIKLARFGAFGKLLFGGPGQALARAPSGRILARNTASPLFGRNTATAGLFGKGGMFLPRSGSLFNAGRNTGNWMKAHPYMTAGIGAGVASPFALAALMGGNNRNNMGYPGMMPGYGMAGAAAGMGYPDWRMGMAQQSLGNRNPYRRGGRRRNKRQRALRQEWKQFNQNWKNRNNSPEDIPEAGAAGPVGEVPVSGPAPAPVAPAAPAAPVAPVAPAITDSASLQPDPTPTLEAGLPGEGSHVISRRAFADGVPVPQELQSRIDAANKESYLRGGIANLPAANVNQNYTGGKYGLDPTPAAPNNPFEKNYTDGYKAQLAAKGNQPSIESLQQSAVDGGLASWDGKNFIPNHWNR